MRRKNLFSLAFLLAVGSAALPVLARAQSQDTPSQTDSVAEAARKARAQKKASDAKPAPVITNDVLKPSAPVAPVASSDATAASTASAAAPSDANSKPAASAETPAPGANSEKSGDQAKSDAELSNLKDAVAQAQKALDLVKRELSLEQDNVYSKPDYQNDSAGKAKIDDLNQQVSDRQQALEDLKARLAELQSKADAQTPPSQEPPPPPQF